MITSFQFINRVADFPADVVQPDTPAVHRAPADAEQLVAGTVLASLALGFLPYTGSVGGLLGTVVGMIATFQMITLFGTGDPRMMAGE